MDDDLLDFHIPAGILLFVFSLSGTIAHSIIIVKCISDVRGLSSFRMYTLAKSITIALISGIFLVWCTPMSFLGQVFIWENSLIDWAFGIYLDSFCFVFIQFCQVFQSLNRVIAVLYIGKYNRICSVSNSVYSLLIAFLCSSSWTLTWALDGYSFTFHPDLLVWVMDYTVKGSQKGMQVLMYFVFGCVIGTLILDSFTFGKLVYGTKENHSLSSFESKRRMKKNNEMFTQKTLEDFFSLLGILNMTVTSTLIKNGWWYFSFNTVSWIAICALEGVIVIHFSNFLRRKNSKKQAMVTIPVSSVRSKTTTTE